MFRRFIEVMENHLDDLLKWLCQVETECRLLAGGRHFRRIGVARHSSGRKATQMLEIFAFSRESYCVWFLRTSLVLQDSWRLVTLSSLEFHQWFDGCDLSFEQVSMAI